MECIERKNEWDCKLPYDNNQTAFSSFEIEPINNNFYIPTPYSKKGEMITHQHYSSPILLTRMGQNDARLKNNNESHSSGIINQIKTINDINNLWPEIKAYNDKKNDYRFVGLSDYSSSADSVNSQIEDDVSLTPDGGKVSLSNFKSLVRDARKDLHQTLPPVSVLSRRKNCSDTK
ncbi:unnamed protein product [Didymodactylos carnosus]|uniref:Uncharacterized protein n=1 Tax=Didymodactylos carnosus TaxID=1234261 RepID=A0A8S2GBW1_9BILA|nr:unnamed protein product [Didymodactylos carnosus]CAF4493887.1 unnamed protein product [Didymodactylos carnosus]